MTKSERAIEIERLRREITRRRLVVLESEARFKLRSDKLNTALEMLKVWSAFNLAAMWGHRDPDVGRE